MADADTTEDRYIALLQRAGDSESFKAGETIFAEGDRADRVYMMKTGTVSLSKDGQLLEHAGPGVVFGELALFDRQAALLVPRAGEPVLRRVRHADDGRSPPPPDGPRSFVTRRNVTRSFS